MASPDNAKDRAALNDARSQIAPDTPPSDTKPCPRMKRLRLGVFFDGTGNNRFRDVALGRETNVVRLWKLYKDNEDAFAIRKKYYLIGVGAVDTAHEDPTADKDPERARQATGDARVQQAAANNEAMAQAGVAGVDLGVFTGEDDWLGQKLGGGMALGTKERLNLAYEWVKSMVAEHHKDHEKTSEKLVDIYGFSRGAGQARTFTNLMNQALRPKEKDCENVRVRFLGIFDTVGSVGVPGALWGGSSDPGQNFGLDSGDFFGCEHFTARDEVRANFPLSELPGFDKEYAGVHSDVGGGYANDYPNGNGKLKNGAAVDPKETGKSNDLSYVTFVDMHKASLDRKVELDPYTLPGYVDIPKLKYDSDVYDGGTAVMYDPNGSFPKDRQAWKNIHIHISYTTSWLGFFEPMKPRNVSWTGTEYKREKYPHKKLTLAGMPPNFSWK